MHCMTLHTLALHYYDAFLVHTPMWCLSVYMYSSMLVHATNRCIEGISPRQAILQCSSAVQLTIRMLWKSMAVGANLSVYNPT